MMFGYLRISDMKCKIICGAANNQLDIIDTAIAKQQLQIQKYYMFQIQLQTSRRSF